MVRKYLVVGLLLMPEIGYSALCGEGDVKGRDRTEVRTMKKQSYYTASSKEDDDYSARVLACNRGKDFKGGEIEKKSNARRDLGQNLKTRYVRGQIRYVEIAPLGYGYAISRSQGVWTVEVPVEFTLPKELPNKLHLPWDVVVKLGLHTKKVCQITKKNKRGKIVSGPVKDGWSTSPYACVVPRSAKHKRALYRYWKDTIENGWSNDAVKYKLAVLNLGRVKRADAERYRKLGMVWPVKFNTNARSRAMYRSEFFNPQPLYSGLEAATILHEFGHILGLDDEYQEGILGPDCKAAPLAGEGYIMCDSYGGKQDIRAIYHWIVTRRYVVGKPGCVIDENCASSHYCKKLPLQTFGACTRKLAKGKPCLLGSHCASGRCRAVCLEAGECKKNRDCRRGEYCKTGLTKPTCANKLKTGSLCMANSHCKTGRCVTGVCRESHQCRRNKDCKSSQYCEHRAFGMSSRCRTLLKDGSPCLSGLHCKSKRCVGFCAKAGECTQHKDCKQSQFCDRGPGGVSKGKCKTKKRNGKLCGADADCKSGRCAWFKKCSPANDCSRDADCDGDEFCAKGLLGFTNDRCVKRFNAGKSCVRKEECKSRKCHWFKCK